MKISKRENSTETSGSILFKYDIIDIYKGMYGWFSKTWTIRMFIRRTS